MKGGATQALPPEIPAWQQERRGRIVDAARTLLEDRDYDQIQIRDIAARSGFALGTVYRYFRSKEHLYAAVMVEWYKWFWETICTDPLPENPRQRIEQLTHRMLNIFENNPQYLRVEIVLETSVDRDAVLLFKKVDEYNKQKYLQNLPNIGLDIIRVVSIVAAAQMHHYVLGHIPIDAAYRQVSKTLSLVFPDARTGDRASASSHIANQIEALGERDREVVMALVTILREKHGADR